MSLELRAKAELERRRRLRDRLNKPIPSWAEPLQQPARYKAAYGGRSGGKSHFFAEQIVKRCVENPDLRVVCIREVQKSLKFSAKLLIEQKIQELGVSHLFTILTTEIRRKGGGGLIIFQGMQDHTADSIKSLEGFGIAWVEEAQRLSARSLALLRPTIRAENSEIWFSWNPEDPLDPVDKFFRGEDAQTEDAVLVSVNYTENPHLSKVALEEALRDRDRDTDYYNHVWLGEYNTRSHLQVFSGKWKVQEFDPLPEWGGALYGADWGFASDPTCAIEAYVWGDRLWIYRESWEIGLEQDLIAERWRRDIPGIENHVVRADSARPETISHVKASRGDRPNIPHLVSVDKWQGSVKDGIEYIRSFKEIIIHPQCRHAQEEFRLYKLKTNAAGDPLPEPQDKNNHIPDSIRYALAPLIKQRRRSPAPPPVVRRGW